MSEDFPMGDYNRLEADRDSLKLENAKLRAALDKAEAAEDLRSLCSGLDANWRAALLQNEAMRNTLKNIASLAIELSDCPDGCPAGSMQREAQRALTEKPKSDLLSMMKTHPFTCGQCGAELTDLGHGSRACQKCFGVRPLWKK